jgi:hypothetical protein
MRAIFIPRRWKTAPSSKVCIKAAGHRDPGTTKLYDQRDYNPDKVSFRPIGCFALTA